MGWLDRFFPSHHPDINGFTSTQDNLWMGWSICSIESMLGLTEVNLLCLARHKNRNLGPLPDRAWLPRSARREVPWLGWRGGRLRLHHARHGGLGRHGHGARCQGGEDALRRSSVERSVRGVFSGHRQRF